MHHFMEAIEQQKMLAWYSGCDGCWERNITSLWHWLWMTNSWAYHDRSCSFCSRAKEEKSHHKLQWLANTHTTKASEWEDSFNSEVTIEIWAISNISHPYKNRKLILVIAFGNTPTTEWIHFFLFYTSCKNFFEEIYTAKMDHWNLDMDFAISTQKRGEAALKWNIGIKFHCFIDKIDGNNSDTRLNYW